MYYLFILSRQTEAGKKDLKPLTVNFIFTIYPLFKSLQEVFLQKTATEMEQVCRCFLLMFHFSIVVMCALFISTEISLCFRHFIFGL